jgi:hypothetical protein
LQKLFQVQFMVLHWQCHCSSPAQHVAGCEQKTPAPTLPGQATTSTFGAVHEAQVTPLPP